MSGKDRPSMRCILVWMGAPLVWFLHFSLIYGAVGFGGALGWTARDLRSFAWAATIVAVLAIALLLWRQRPRLLALLSLAAVLLQGVVLALVPA